MIVQNGMQQGLRQHHRKLTRPRQAILDIIAAADHHLTVAEIHKRARKKYPHLGLVTVYRTLDLLTELGYVQRVHFTQGCHSYAAIAQGHAHHLVCSSCGRAEEFEDCDLEPLIATLQRKTGYEINVHMLELMGRCPKCARAGRKRRDVTP
ncbi:MAG TPA: Fur family transcriptional regulator [Anaerolineae bacterium]|nr:Fur family transcriptional regulator [Anaerolineae bacterium]